MIPDRLLIARSDPEWRALLEQECGIVLSVSLLYYYNNENYTNYYYNNDNYNDINYNNYDYNHNDDYYNYDYDEIA